MTPEEEIKRIKEALIGYKPEYFKTAFCDHEWEEITEVPAYRGESSSGKISIFPPIIRCRKCMTIKDNYDRRT